MTFIDVVYPCIETLIFSARKIHLFLFSYSCQHYLFRYVPTAPRQGFPFTECSATPAFKARPNFGILLRPNTFSMPYWKPRNAKSCGFDHWAITLSLKDGCFQAYFMVVFSKTSVKALRLERGPMTILISLSKHKNNLCPPYRVVFWDLHFGSGLFPFWQWPLSATFWLFSINLMVFLD